MYYIYAEDAQENVLLNTAEVEKAPAVQFEGWAACAALAILAVLLLCGIGYVIHARWLLRITMKGRIQLAVIITAMLSAVLVSTVLVDDLNQRYVEERASKMTNLAVMLARDFAPEDIRSLDSRRTSTARPISASTSRSRRSYSATSTTTAPTARCTGRSTTLSASSTPTRA